VTANRLNRASRLMRRSWDARSDLSYVDSRRRNWIPHEFYASGREEATALLHPAFERLGFDPAGKRILEIGCGPGRLFPGHADFFAEICGVDVSPEMIRRGEALCPVEARFILGTGHDLEGIEDASIDYCFSYLAFQHFPCDEVVWAYFDEMGRVLRPGGCFQVQLLARRTWRARIARIVGSRVPGNVKTWIGATIPRSRAQAEATARGFCDVTTYDISPAAYWLIGSAQLI
jgi:SAM-dependent methyltransferase